VLAFLVLCVAGLAQLADLSRALGVDGNRWGWCAGGSLYEEEIRVQRVQGCEFGLEGIAGALASGDGRSGGVYFKG